MSYNLIYPVVYSGSSGFSFLVDMCRWTSVIASMLIAFSPYAQIDPVLLGSLPAAIDEASGLYCPAPDTCWTHNDDSDGARIFAISANGAFIEQRFIGKAGQVDYESISGGSGEWLLGDFGNNENDRMDLTIYRFTDPQTTEDDILLSTPIFFQIQDQTAFPPPQSQRNFDIEAMVHRAEDILLFTRNRTVPYSGITKVYRLNTTDAVQTAQIVGSFLTTGNATTSAVTGAALAPGGELLVLCSSEGLYVYQDFDIDNTDFNDYEHIAFSTVRPYEGVDLLDDCMVRLITEGATDGGLYELDLCALELEENAIDDLPIEINSTGIRYTQSPTLNLQLFGIDGRLHRSSQRGWLPTMDLVAGVYILIIPDEDIALTITLGQP